ncbi:MAG: lipoyl synthase [Desulfobacteraceae bacterium]|nr:MAG: lipoyl synthase [Desulfobacteraceae bacterium]
MPKPPWLRRRLADKLEFGRVRSLMKECSLHTVCESARCPNIWECFSRKTATFLIMGNRCTRNCRFCAIEPGPLGLPDPEEAFHVAEAVDKMGLAHAVITSVTRDDLPDFGVSCFVKTVQEIRKRSRGITIEVLVPDFCGNKEAIASLIEARPDVIAHNMETVPGLYPHVRPQAVYEISLALLRQVSESGRDIFVKSGMMLGLGETEDEIIRTLDDLLFSGCRILTLGQYLQPTASHIPVERFLPPEEFQSWQEKATAMGFQQVVSGPFVRSSYHAGSLFRAMQSSGKRPGPDQDPE